MVDNIDGAVVGDSRKEDVVVDSGEIPEVRTDKCCDWNVEDSCEMEKTRGVDDGVVEVACVEDRFLGQSEKGMV